MASSSEFMRKAATPIGPKGAAQPRACLQQKEAVRQRRQLEPISKTDSQRPRLLKRGSGQMDGEAAIDNQQPLRKKTRSGGLSCPAENAAEDEFCSICRAAIFQHHHCQHPCALEKIAKRLEARLKTIAIMKEKPQYCEYVQNVPKNQRTKQSPMTPPAEEVFEIKTRMWKNMTLEWHKQLARREWGVPMVEETQESRMAVQPDPWKHFLEQVRQGEKWADSSSTSSDSPRSQSLNLGEMEFGVILPIVHADSYEGLPIPDDEVAQHCSEFGRVCATDVAASGGEAMRADGGS